MKSFMRWASLTGVLLLVGCTAVTRPRAIPDDPAYAPVLPQDMLPAGTSNGSLFRPARNFSFFGDRVALNVGDILTITLDERTSATKSATTDITKDNEITFNEPSILGSSLANGRLSFLTNPNFERDFAADAQTDQSNRLTGNIAVTVVEVLPNGVLRVRGEKWVSLSQGDEFVRLTGLVRAEDIAPDNTISSTRVADARISYGGTGDLDQANRMGWLSRLFNSEWWPL